MTTPIILTVACVPVAQPRQRHTRDGRNYTPADHPVHTFKSAVREAWRVSGGTCWDGPVRVDATFVFPRPQSKVWKTKPMPRYPHLAMPDRDNLDKAILDALQHFAWTNDSRVYCGWLEKWVAAGDEQPSATLVIYQE